MESKEKSASVDVPISDYYIPVFCVVFIDERPTLTNDELLKLTGCNLFLDDLAEQAKVFWIFDIKNQTAIFSFVFNADIFVEEAIKSFFHISGNLFDCLLFHFQIGSFFAAVP